MAVGVAARPGAPHSYSVKSGKETLGRHSPRYRTQYLHDAGAASQSPNAHPRQHTRVVFGPHRLSSRD